MVYIEIEAWITRNNQEQPFLIEICWETITIQTRKDQIYELILQRSWIAQWTLWMVFWKRTNSNPIKMWPTKLVVIK